MKPTRLVISAFGPYKDQVEIPLERLGENGIYLITGDTGAGKTTIFDAITFALFDVSSGGNRSKKMFRSIYADEKTPTYVEMEFLYRKEKYWIKRIPEYDRLKKSGEGYTKQNSDAHLIYPDGREISGVSNVNQAINELLGMDKDQFTQIAMIAQGDFLDLLLAKSEDRQKLFRNIFKTNNFDLIEQRLREERSLYSRKLLDLDVKDRSILDGFKIYGENTSLEKLLDQEKPWHSRQLLSLIEEELEGEERAYEKNKKDLEQRLRDVDHSQDRYKRAKKYLEDAKKLEAYRDDLIQQLKIEEDLILQRKSLSGKETRARELNLELDRLKEDLEVYGQLEAWKNELDQVLRRKESLGLEEEKIAIKTKDLEGEKEDLEKDLLQAPKRREDLVRKTGEKKEVARLDDQVFDLRMNLNALDQDGKNLLKEERFLLKLRENYQLSKEEFDRSEEIYFQGQAGILALSLKPASPCPVCGSLDHPSKASLDEDLPSEEELKEKKQRRDKLAVKVQESFAKYEGLKARLDSKKSQILDQAKNILEKEYEDLDENFHKDLVDLEASLSQSTIILDSYLEEVEKKLREGEKNQARLDRVKKDLDQARLDGENLREEARELRTKREILASRLEEKSGNLAFKSKKEAQAHYMLLSKEEEGIRRELEDFKLLYEKNISSKARLESAIKILEEGLDPLDQGDLDKLKDQLESLEGEVLDLTNKDKELYFLLENNKSCFAKLKQSQKIRLKLELKYGQLDDLYKTVAGQLSDKEKIKFETYVQMAYFEEIIDRANDRFSQMTNGQYELRRKIDDNDRSSQAGLDLEVKDFYTLDRRDIRTLSGGESFKAALSLALGLSDTVQMYAGGIELETMFVDEGFGSLDKESLNQVIRTLVKLSKGNKLIGIISHVDSLKERIDKKIVVKKDKSGASSVDFEV